MAWPRWPSHQSPLTALASGSAQFPHCWVVITEHGFDKCSRLPMLLLARSTAHLPGAEISTVQPHRPRGGKRNGTYKTKEEERKGRISGRLEDQQEGNRKRKTDRSATKTGPGAECYVSAPGPRCLATWWCESARIFAQTEKVQRERWKRQWGYTRKNKSDEDCCTPRYCSDLSLYLPPSRLPWDNVDRKHLNAIITFSTNTECLKFDSAERCEGFALLIFMASLPPLCSISKP